MTRARLARRCQKSSPTARPSAFAASHRRINATALTGHTLLLIFAIALALGWTVMGLRALPGMRRTRPLQPGTGDFVVDHGATASDGCADASLGQPADAGDAALHHGASAALRAADASLPRVTVIVPARNEQFSILHTLDTLQRQTYPNLEIIAVDDRSTDDTGRLLDAAASTWPATPPLTVLHVQTLPDGWLGKNHALYEASRRATGEWLLFTDADIEFHLTAIAQAVARAVEEGADHITVPPTIRTKGLALGAAVTFFTYNMMVVFRPQAANLDGSKVSMGIGAFNLVRLNAYEAMGTHKAMAMSAVDDLDLAQRLRSAGRRQRFVPGPGLVEVEWYKSFSDMLRGLEKNSLAPFGYSYLLFTMAMVGCLLFYLGPIGGVVWGLVAGSGLAAAAFAYCFAWLTGLYVWLGRLAHFSLGWLLTLPLGVCLLVFALVRGAWLTARRGGIEWRGTRYSLKELRKHAR
ncbi:glycosyltransferase [Alicyclobacillus sp. ALC3]|uniref:glycosyltransferase n=1 Tax=Alicyclobacillus sp. ALC3 TaxID=2796143 RepID=UPI002377F089|nr:glycosyltransferase family 2 protein [Alicyclobacillus sp. ALC3]WDL97777.1 glycosyltransferase [Alicyclobacillus sp. ALC3]